jgi:predicted phage tail protein
MENPGVQSVVAHVAEDRAGSDQRRFSTLLGGLVLRATFYALVCAVLAVLVASAVL